MNPAIQTILQEIAPALLAAIPGLIALRSQKKKFDAELKKTQTEADNAAAETAEHFTKIARDLVDPLTDRINGQEADIVRLKADNLDAYKKIDVLKNQLELRETEAEQLQAQIDRQNRDIAMLQKQSIEKDEKIRAQSAEIEMLRKGVNDLVEQLCSLGVIPVFKPSSDI